MKPDLGNVPDWIAAIGTSGALFFVIYQHFRDRRRDQETARQEQARQARLISVSASGGFNSDLGFKYGFGVQNDSGLLIRNVRPVVEDRHSGTDQISPGQTAAAIAVLEPGRRHDFQVRVLAQLSRDTAVSRREQMQQVEQTLRAGVEFTDAEGRRWLQLPDGNPELRDTVGARKRRWWRRRNSGQVSRT